MRVLTYSRFNRVQSRVRFPSEVRFWYYQGSALRRIRRARLPGSMRINQSLSYNIYI